MIGASNLINTEVDLPNLHHKQMTDVFEGTGQREGNFSGALLQNYSEEQYQSEGLPSGHQDGLIGGGTDQHDGSIVETSVSLQEASSSFRRKVAGRSADGKDQEGDDAASLKKRYWLSTKDEGILDRFNRLDWEVRELEKELQENENQEDLVDLDGVHIADKVKQLTSRLSHLNKRALETPLEKIGLASDNLALLKNDLKRVKAGSSSAGRGGLATVEHENNTQNQVVYELALDSRVLSSASLSASDEKTFQLEQRITNLERVIGIHSLDPASSVIGQESTSLFATSGTLIGALERIDHHLSMLADPLVFDQTLRRVKEATAALDKLAELKRKHKLDQRMGAAAGKAEGQFELGSGTGIFLLVFYLI